MRDYPRVAYPGEIDSAQYDTPGILTLRSMYDTPGILTLRSMIPRGDCLSPVWYPGEIDSVLYDTPERSTGMITPGEIFTKKSINSAKS